jgi:hypothetical protein
MYFSLNMDPAANVYMRKETGLNSHVNLMIGRRYDIVENEIELPYRYIMTVSEGQTPLMYGYYSGAFLMQLRLAQVLRSAGVDNLQLFPANIRREDAADEISGYTTFNVVGRIACAALKKSKSMPVANSKFFTDLTIDPAKTSGQLMFRLHESPLLVLLHESVAKLIEAENFLGVVLKPIKEAVET